jgi:hemolysin activation/secretion protein
MRGTSLGHNFSLITRVSGQRNILKPLPSIEQFANGGSSTVRGYPESALTGDSGFNASNEMDFPFLRHQWATRVQGDIFVEGGAVYGAGTSTATQPKDTRLLSSGFGFLAKITTHYSGRIDFGVPVRNNSGISAVGIHYSVQTTFGLPHRWAPTPKGKWLSR